MTNEMIGAELLASLELVCIPIYSTRHEWWAGFPNPQTSVASNPIVKPFEGILRRLGGRGTWFRELEFDDLRSIVPTTSCGDVESEYRRTPAGSWLWVESECRVLCYCNDACDAHVLCMDRATFEQHGLEAPTVSSLRANVAAISRLPNPVERRWHAIFFLHHLRWSIQLPGMSVPGFLGSLAV